MLAAVARSLVKFARGPGGTFSGKTDVFQPMVSESDAAASLASELAGWTKTATPVAAAMKSCIGFISLFRLVRAADCST